MRYAFWPLTEFTRDIGTGYVKPRQLRYGDVGKTDGNGSAGISILEPVEPFPFPLGISMGISILEPFPS